MSGKGGLQQDETGYFYQLCLKKLYNINWFYQHTGKLLCCS